MGDFILRQGDKVNFLPAFPPAIVEVKPGQLKATSQNVQINGKAVCLAKDSQNVKVAGCMYTAPPFVMPGSGTLSIAQLAPNQSSKKVRCNGKPLLLKGTQCQARFKVASGAKTPPAPPVAPAPDPMPQYMGFALLLNSNNVVSAS